MQWALDEALHVAAEPSPLLSEVSEGKWTPPFVPISGGDMKSLIESPLHFITGGSREDALYNLANDPAEETNLMATTAGKLAATRMKSTIESLVEVK